MIVDNKSLHRYVKTLDGLNIVEVMGDQTWTPPLERQRDEWGRFLPNEYQLPTEPLSLRQIRVTRKKDSYNTYLVQDAEPFIRLLGTIGLLCIIGALCIFA